MQKSMVKRYSKKCLKGDEKLTVLKTALKTGEKDKKYDWISLENEKFMSDIPVLLNSYQQQLENVNISGTEKHLNINHENFGQFKNIIEYLLKLKREEDHWEGMNFDYSTKDQEFQENFFSKFDYEKNIPPRATYETVFIYLNQLKYFQSIAEQNKSFSNSKLESLKKQIVNIQNNLDFTGFSKYSSIEYLKKYIQRINNFVEQKKKDVVLTEKNKVIFETLKSNVEKAKKRLEMLYIRKQTKYFACILSDSKSETMKAMAITCINPILNVAYTVGMFRILEYIELNEDLESLLQSFSAKMVEKWFPDIKIMMTNKYILTNLSRFPKFSIRNLFTETKKINSGRYKYMQKLFDQKASKYVKEKKKTKKIKQD